MKKLIIAALALVSFSAASFAQATPAVKKTNATSVQATKKQSDQQSSKVAALSKTTKQSPGVAATAKPKKEATPAEQKYTAAGTKIKKHKAAKSTSTAQLKKSGAKQKENKKHS